MNRIERASRTTRRRTTVRAAGVILVVAVLAGAAGGCSTTRGLSSTYKDPEIDLSLVQTVAVLPFANLTADDKAGERVRDVFSTMMQATGAVYVVPPGEVAKAVGRARTGNANEPSPEEVTAIGSALKADVVVTGVVREYGQVRSGNSTANAIAVSVKIFATESGKVVWSGASTAGGVTASDRFFGGGGEPMELVTEDALTDLIDQIFD
jgi:TolB-like protein